MGGGQHPVIQNFTERLSTDLRWSQKKKDDAHLEKDENK
jgi:hypothetical protein